MTTVPTADSFHRLAKSLLDCGEASTVAEAMTTFGRYGVRVRLPSAFDHDAVGQAIALTAINAASRSFLGNVLVEADDVELTVRGFEGMRLNAFLDWCGVRTSTDDAAASWPTILVGDTGTGGGSEVRAWADGWRFGIGRSASVSPTFFAPACVAAGGLAVSEAFSLMRRDNPYAGRRDVTLSLWNPTDPAEKGPGPGSLAHVGGAWLIGLGHLGQAYAWTLTFMERAAQPLVLQDVDTVGVSTISTSMVTAAGDVGRLKTRVVDAWLSARGFETRLVERRFDEHQRVARDEPRTALLGVDNPSTRRVLEGFGADLVVDAGLGAGFNDFRALRVRTFPGPSRAADIWALPQQTSSVLAPAYAQLVREGADRCGVTVLASRAVGAPFVGCVAAGYALGECMRRAVGGRALGFLDLNLRSPGRLELG